MLKRTALYFTVLMLFLTGTLTAQIKCTIERYSTENGLSHNRIMCMIRDHEGFMWFGTWDGLNRFDGHNFVVYKSRPGDNSSLGNSRIQSMVEDTFGNLWLKAYDNRIYRFNKKTKQFLPIVIKPLDKNSGEPVYDKIILSKKGHIWISTSSQGIYLCTRPNSANPQFNGFEAANPAPSSILSNKIKFLFEDQQANLWVATDKGLSCLQHQTKGTYISSTLHKPYSKISNYSCVSDNGTQLWFGTANGELVCFDKSKRNFTIKKIAGSELTAITFSKNLRDVYISNAAAELLIINRRTQTSKSTRMHNGTIFYSIYEDKQGYLWLQAENYGVIRYDPYLNKFRHFEQKSDAYQDRTANFFKVFEDARGLVWVSMRRGGFGYYDQAKDEVSYFYNEPGKANSHFSNVAILTYLDPLGTLWLHADDKGLNKIVFPQDNFNRKLVVDPTVTRSDNEIRGICNDNKNRLWLASKSGKIFVYQNNQQINISFRNVPAEGIGIVYTIIQDKKGRMWLGTRTNGLYLADPVDSSQTTYHLTHFLKDEKNSYSISSNSIYSLFEDAAGKIWVGTYGEGINLVRDTGSGLRFINKNNLWSHFPKAAFSKVRYLREDHQRNLWVATTDGLMILPGSGNNLAKVNYRCYSKVAGDAESLGKNDIQYIFQDSNHTMWLATSGGGLNKVIGKDVFKHLKFKAYTTENGLTSDYILSCIEDRSKFLWLATENGLSKFNPSTGEVVNYDSYDGLPKSGFSEASCLKLPSGNLVFGALSGYVSFNPVKIVNHMVNVNLVLTKLLINNAEVVVNDKAGLLKQDINDLPALTLEHNQNIISLDYTLLDYRLGNKLSYAYRLIGFDSTWRDNKEERRATYTNLPPGKYTFQVKSLNVDLYSNSPHKSLMITILPPLYLTWWAYVIYILLAALLVGVIRRVVLTLLKLRQRIVLGQKMADLKVTFFTNVSHELRTPLTLILNPIEEISKDPELSTSVKQHLNVVRKNADRLVRFINQLLDLNKVESGKASLKISQLFLLAFIRNITEYFADVAREKDIKLKIESDVSDFQVWLDPEKIDIVIYNILANAFKFTPNGKSIVIRVRQLSDQDSFLIELADQGGGVPENRLSDIFELYYVGDQEPGNNLKGTGIGLALSKGLVELHTGTIWAKNNSVQGLTVSIQLPAGKAYLDQLSFVELRDSRVEHQILTNDPLPQSDDAVLKIPPPGAMLVLLVEDNSDLRNFLKVQLSEHYRIELAENGREGLTKALKLLPDLIVSDVMMPQMDGIQLLDQLKNNMLTSHIPLVLLTARSAVEHQLEGLRYGADYYITKPFRNDFLLACIENLLKQRKKIVQTLMNGKRPVIIGPGEINITAHDEAFLRKIIQILEERMTDSDFNIDSVADSMNMGRSTFYKKLKSLTTLTPVEFIRDIRMKRARQYLDSAEYNISDIAYLVGFSNAKYFSTCFKEKYQMSPSDYLKSKTKDL